MVIYPILNVWSERASFFNSKHRSARIQRKAAKGKKRKLNR